MILTSTLPIFHPSSTIISIFLGLSHATKSLKNTQIIIYIFIFNLNIFQFHMQLPSVEEIESLLSGRKLTTIIFFLDETFEELQYDITTTAIEAVEYLAGVIKLENYSTFTLYECRKVLK